MKLTIWEEEMSFKSNKILLVKLLEGSVKCINGEKWIKVIILMEHKKVIQIKKTTIKKKNVLIENYKTMKKNPDFEQNYYSETAEGIHKVSQYSIRIMKLLCYADRPYYESVNNFVLMATFLTCHSKMFYLWLMCTSKK